MVASVEVSASLPAVPRQVSTQQASLEVVAILSTATDFKSLDRMTRGGTWGGRFYLYENVGKDAGLSNIWFGGRALCMVIAACF